MQWRQCMMQQAHYLSRWHVYPRDQSPIFVGFHILCLSLIFTLMHRLRWIGHSAFQRMFILVNRQFGSQIHDVGMACMIWWVFVKTSEVEFLNYCHFSQKYMLASSHSYCQINRVFLSNGRSGFVCWRVDIRFIIQLFKYSLPCELVDLQEEMFLCQTIYLMEGH